MSVLIRATMSVVLAGGEIKRWIDLQLRAMYVIGKR